MTTPARPARQKAAVPLLSLVFIVLAALATLPATAAAWEQRVLMNQHRFVSLGNDVLAKDAVQQKIATDLSKGIDGVASPLVKNVNNLLNGVGVPKGVTDIIGSVLGGGSKPATSATSPAAPTLRDNVIRPLALDFARTLPNSPLANTSLVATHKGLVTAIRSDSITASNDAITIDLTGGVPNILGQIGVGGANPGESGKIVLIRQSDLATEFKWARWFDGHAVLFALLPIGLLVAGIALARNRGLACVYAGGALIVASILWILLMKVPVRDAVVAKANDAEGMAAAGAAFDVVSKTFVSQELVVIVAGAVLVILGLVISSMRPRPAPVQAAPSSWRSL